MANSYNLKDITQIGVTMANNAFYTKPEKEKRISTTLSPEKQVKLKTIQNLTHQSSAGVLEASFDSYYKEKFRQQAENDGLIQKSPMILLNRTDFDDPACFDLIAKSLNIYDLNGETKGIEQIKIDVQKAFATKLVA